MSWLDEIYKYTRHSKQESGECFVTAALSRLLDIDEEMKKWLWCKAKLRKLSASVTVLHQDVWQGMIEGTKLDKETLRPDIVLIEANDSDEPKQVLIIEAKIDASVEKQQPQKYYLRAIKKYKGIPVDVIVLSCDRIPSELLLYSHASEEVSFINITWDQLYQKFHGDGWKRTDMMNAVEYLRTEFFELIKEWNMIADPPLSKAVNEAVMVYDRFKTQMQTILRKLVPLLDKRNSSKYTYRENTYWYTGARYESKPYDFGIYVFYDTHPEPGRTELKEDGNVFFGIFDYSNNSKLINFKKKGFYNIPYWKGNGFAIRLSDVATKHKDFYKLNHIDQQVKILAKELEPAFLFLKGRSEHP